MNTLQKFSLGLLVVLLALSCSTGKSSAVNESIAEVAVIDEKAPENTENVNPEAKGEVLPSEVPGDIAMPELPGMPEGQMPPGMANGMMPGGGMMGFAAEKVAPAEFSSNVDTSLYRLSVSSPEIPETFYDSEDILILDNYLPVVFLLKGNSYVSGDLPAGVTAELKEDKLTIKNESSNLYNYYFEGSFEGTIAIESDNADYAVTLNDATIVGKTLPAMQLKSATKAFFYIAEDSVNNISDSRENEKNGVITSDGDIIINGMGILNIDVYKKHGLKVDGTVRVVSGELFITCDELCEGNGISADDAYIQDGGDVVINALGSVYGEESKGIKVNGRESDNPKGYIVINGGSLEVTSIGKALTAGFKAEEDGETETTKDDPTPNLYINNGVVRINTTGEIYEVSEEESLSPEGLEAKKDLIINGGFIEICSTDDALNAGERIVINSGVLFAYSTGADGIDSNGIVEINGGVTVAFGSSVPEMAIDCDNNRNFSYNGGYVAAFSGGGSNSPMSADSKGYALSYGGKLAANETLVLLDKDGNAVFAFRMPGYYSTASGGVVASDYITKGSEYKVYRGAEVISDYFFNGAYAGNITISGGQEIATITIEDSVTSIGLMGGMGFPGGEFGRGKRELPEGMTPEELDAMMLNQGDFGKGPLAP